MMNDEQTINGLLRMMFPDDLIIRKWLYGYNKAFGMSPDQMMKDGRHDEVISYLVYQIEGPY